jgi:signal peptidase II
MNINKNNKLVIFFSLILAILILDRFTKILSSTVSGCFLFCIRHTTNPGMAFSLFNQFSWIKIVLILIGLIVLIICSYMYFREKDMNRFHFGLIFLFSGTLCNLLDRIFFGHVLDWLRFSFPSPTFNLADLSNIVGVLLIVVYLFTKSSKQQI